MSTGAITKRSISDQTSTSLNESIHFPEPWLNLDSGSGFSCSLISVYKKTRWLNPMQMAQMGQVLYKLYKFVQVL